MKQNKLVAFYEAFINFLDYVIEDNGIIVSPIGEPLKDPSSTDALPLAIPVPEALNTLMSRENGKLVQKHEIFNPLREMAVGGVSPDVQATLSALASKIAFLVTEGMVNSVEAILGNTDTISDQVVLRIQTALSEIEAKGTGEIIDDKTDKNIAKFFNRIIKKGSNVINIWPIKGKAIGNTGYSRAIQIEFCYMDIISNDAELRKYSIRKKDALVIGALTRMFFVDIDDDNRLVVGSVLEDATTFDAIMELLHTYIFKLADFIPDMNIPKLLETYTRNRPKLMEYAKVIIAPKSNKPVSNKPKIARQTTMPTNTPQNRDPTPITQNQNQPPEHPNNPTNHYGNPTQTMTQPNGYPQQHTQMPPTTFGNMQPNMPPPQPNQFGQVPPNNFGQPQPLMFGQTPPNSFGQPIPNGFGNVPPNMFGNPPPVTFGNQPQGAMQYQQMPYNTPQQTNTQYDPVIRNNSPFGRF